MARVTVKHATASVFLFGCDDNAWHIGLIRHPRLGKWMLPGGHVEPDENPAEAALREVAEEAGLAARPRTRWAGRSRRTFGDRAVVDR